MLGNPCSKCFTGQSLGDVNVISALTSKIKNLGDIDVTQSLHGACLLFELLPDGRIDAFYWEQRYGNRFTGSFVHGFVGNRGTISAEFIRRAVRAKADPIMLKEYRALHDRVPLAAARSPYSPHRPSFNLDFGSELLSDEGFQLAT